MVKVQHQTLGKFGTSSLRILVGDILFTVVGRVEFVIISIKVIFSQVAVAIFGCRGGRLGLY